MKNLMRSFRLPHNRNFMFSEKPNIVITYQEITDSLHFIIWFTVSEADCLFPPETQ